MATYVEIQVDSIQDAAEKMLGQYVGDRPYYQGGQKFYLHVGDRPYYQGGQKFYLHGWRGIGVPAVFAAMAKLARTHRYKFQQVIHVDCSLWESKRAMQRIIAENLNLNKSTMALFDKQDEDDDFNGVPKSSRAEIDDVAEHITNVLRDQRCLVLFNNGSNDEIDLIRSGIPMPDPRNMVVWSFGGRFRLLDPALEEKALKSSDVFFMDQSQSKLVQQLVHEEAGQVSQEVNPATVAECWLYLSLLHYKLDSDVIDNDHHTHASNYWVCDGIIQGDGAWEVGEKLLEAMRLDHLPSKTKHSKWFDMLCDIHQNLRSKWISVTSNSEEVQSVETIPNETTTSYFLTLGSKSSKLDPLQMNLFQHATNLRVLKLSGCTFSFSSPPFTCCNSLRFISIRSCIDEDATSTYSGDEQQDTKWLFLQTLWVLDIHDTYWDWILTPMKMSLMTELSELNIKAAGARRCVREISTIQLAWLCNLKRLRVINSSTFLRAVEQESFAGMMKLELLDLSGTIDMEVLPNLSKETNLKVLILDGCGGLEHVEPNSLPTSLESFSYDGFGAASRWNNSLQIPKEEVRLSAPVNEKPPKVLKISLKGCARLKNVFLRWFPNLNELNLSETAIQGLDLEDMLVTHLELLFLIGCEHLRRVNLPLENLLCLKLLYVDTRGKARRSMDDYQQPCPLFHYHRDDVRLVHLITTDARLLRGLDKYAGFLLGYGRGLHDHVLHGHHSHVHLSTVIGSSMQLGGGNMETEFRPSSEPCRASVASLSLPYADILRDIVNLIGEDDNKWRAWMQLDYLDNHIEISQGGCNWETEDSSRFVDAVQTLHVHDNSSITCITDSRRDSVVYHKNLTKLRWCRIERCRKLQTFFGKALMGPGTFEHMKTLWASDLPVIRCIWNRDIKFYDFDRLTKDFRCLQMLRYIYLYSCPRLEFVLPWCFHTLSSLETIHIAYCGELTQIFPTGEPYDEGSPTPDHIEFPCLRKVHLLNLPMLKHISEARMVAPSLETIKIRGCWSLRQLPAIEDQDGSHCRPSSCDMPSAKVDCEKNWWDRLRWDGVEASRPFYKPFHSRYYSKAKPRGSILR